MEFSWVFNLNPNLTLPLQPLVWTAPPLPVSGRIMGATSRNHFCFGAFLPPRSGAQQACRVRHRGGGTPAVGKLWRWLLYAHDRTELELHTDERWYLLPHYGTLTSQSKEKKIFCASCLVFKKWNEEKPPEVLPCRGLWCGQSLRVSWQRCPSVAGWRLQPDHH